MLAELLLALVPVVIPAQRTPAPELDELDSRLRPFSCPAGLHDVCSSTARHDLPVDTGLVG